MTNQRISKWLWCCFFLAVAVGPDFCVGADKWSSIRSKNFLLVGNASESQIRRVAKNLEEFRAGFANLFPSAGQEATVGTTVVVFKNDESFRPFKPLYQGKPANIAGYFQSGEDVNFIALSADIQSPHVIYHEFVHSLTKDSASRLPVWASEGLAEFYAMFESNGKDLLFGRAIADHVAVLGQAAFLPLDTLFAVGPGSPFYNESTKQGIFYAESWAVVHYLMIGNNGQRRPQFAKYIGLIAAGKPIDESFREAFQVDYSGLEREVRDYIRGRLAWPAITVKLPDKLDFDREMQSSPLSDSQAQYYLGDLLLHTNRLDTAETQLRKAISLDPKLGGSYASLGLLMVRQEKYEDALSFLTQAVERDSKNFLAHYYYAYMLELDKSLVIDNAKRLELMRTHLKQSIELAPHFVEAYSLLGYVTLRLRDELRETEDLLKKAFAFAPGRPELRIRLAELMIENDEAAAARFLLTPLKNLVGNEGARNTAERLLEDIAAQLQSGQTIHPERDEDEVVEKSSDERPKLTRNATPSTPDDLNTNPTRPTNVPGLTAEGFLTLIDCSHGMTLRVRIGNGNVEFHTDQQLNVDFVSNVPQIKDSIGCGPVEPELPVMITYKRSTDPRFRGEPVRVEFIEKN